MGIRLQKRIIPFAIAFMTSLRMSEREKIFAIDASNGVFATRGTERKA